MVLEFETLDLTFCKFMRIDCTRVLVKSHCPPKGDPKGESGETITSK